MIEALELTKLYGKKLAVNAVSFFVERGEVVGLLGPNGAGKTTIMRMLTGFVPPTSGTARIAGFDVQQNAMEVKKRIGYLPELPPLYPEMRVREYLGFAAALRLLPRADRASAVASAIERCGLAEMADRRVEHLSKGYRQRVGLAQAIVHSPEMIILDEPTSGLDPRQVLEARGLVRDLSDKVTVLVSSHILSEVEATCSRVIIVNRGNLVTVATPAELRHKLREGGRQTVWIGFSGPVDAIVQRMQSLPAVTEVAEHEKSPGDHTTEVVYKVLCEGEEDCRNALARCVIDAGGQLLSLREEQFSLEKAFIQLTQDRPEGSDEADAADL